MKLKQPIRAAFFAISFACLVPAAARAQGVWNNNDDRDYHGTPPVLDSPYWSFGYVAPTQSNPNGHVGNWGGVPYPGSGGVTSAILGAPGNTYCDVQVSLNALTINPGGQLTMGSSSVLTVASTNIATDGTMVNGLVSGGFPVFNNAGTFRKSAGNGLYSIDSAIVFNSLSGSTIQVDSGSLQLPGIQGLFDTVTFNTAAGTTIDLVGDRGQFGENWFQGTLTNTTGVGTVRLRANRMRDNIHGDQKCTLNFPGSVFQWVGGTMGGTASGEVPVFTNVGVMNLSGGDTKYAEAFINNKNLMIQSGAGNFDIRADTVANLAGATYDLQSDAGIVTTYYGAFTNAGLFKKSAGTGTSTINTYFSHLGGTVEVDSGTLLLPTAQHTRTAISTGGNFVVAAGSLIDLGSGEVFGGTYTGSGAGTVQMSAGVIYGDIDNNYPTVFNFPAGLFQWKGGTIGNYPGELFTNTGTINIPSAGGVTILGQFTNAGTVIQSGAGSFNDGGGSTITNNAGAVFDLRSDGGVLHSTNSAFKFTNNGTLQKSGGTGTSTVSSYLVNNGTVAAFSGTLDISYDTDGVRYGTLPSGTWTVANGAALTISAYPNGVTVNQATVVLNGANAQFPAINGLTDNQGTFSLLAGRQFTTAGALSNEGTLTLDAGSTLHVSGAYTGSGTSTVAFTVGGTNSQGAQSAGVLQVNGAATLGGALSVKLGAGVQLHSGDTITVMAATGGISGAFANVANGARINTADGTGSFQVNYGSGSAFNANTVVLSGFEGAGVVTHPAFFNGEAALGENTYYLAFPGNGNIFGYYQFYYAADTHFLYHFDLGFEYVFDAADGHGGVYLYDFKSNTFWYTSPTFAFPYLYDFSLQAFLYYYPDPTNPQRYNTNGVRYFYNFSTGQIISK